ncbi:MAG: molybdopterin-dependent oxidoreductase [Oscillospiraceae bacterium]|nr:molybdopterin-dependent oxidoreductase [Oscillospiraceae bacterium]
MVNCTDRENETPGIAGTANCGNTHYGDGGIHMSQGNVDIRAHRRVFKAASLLGPRSGLPTVVESDSDGRLTRIRPLHYEDYIDWNSKNPWRIEARGSAFTPPKRTLPGCYYMSYKKRVYSENRVRYPLKRVDWDPRGERNTQNRGKSGYARISWDEAAQLIADELTRVREKYGMTAVLSEADMHGEGKHTAPSHGCANRLLSLLGGYTIQMRNMDSWEGYAWGSKNVWGGEPVGEMQPSGNVWPDIAKNTEMLLFWAADPETTSVGFDGYLASRLSSWIHSLGVKFVYVDPALNYSACRLADKWIPVLPNTDAALYLAIAHVWLTEGAYDGEYVKTHAVGAEPFFDYVLGKEDGEPKTPAWASEKCGVPEWTIKALARAWGKKITSISIGNGGPGIRGAFSTEPARLQSILLGMQGLGKSGVHQVKWLEWHLHTDPYTMPYQGEATINLPVRADLVPTPVAADTVIDEAFLAQQALIKGNVGGSDNVTNNFRKFATARGWRDDAEIEEAIRRFKELTTDGAGGPPPQQSIPKCMVHDAILKDRIEWWGLLSFCGPAEEQWTKHVFPAPGCSRIHMIWTDSPCMVTCWNDGFNFVKAMRSPEIECVVAQHPWMENDCYLADIILPVATKFEMEDIADDAGGGVFTSVYHEYPACPPVGLSRNDFDCVAAVAKKLGGDIYNAYTGNEISIKRVIELFWQGSGVAHLDTGDEFRKKDIFVVPADPDIQKKPAGLSLFALDPDSNPLTTPTGKLEFTSTAISEHFPDDAERPPHPKWVESSALHDERLTGARAERYPLLCMSNHGRWRFHAQLDDVTWSREIDTMKIRARDGYQYEPAWIHPETAAARGIEYGDIVKVYNERGAVLCAAYLTQRLMPGVVYVDHGARFDPIDAETLDRGGAINLISPHAITSGRVTGMVISGFLVETEKVSDEAMAAWRARYPDSFSRATDPAAGVCLDGWVR